MKKSLIALAVLAASGASFAQSSVTLYGIVDAYVGREKANDVTTTKLDSGGISTNRFGFKGTEDLGGGLRANFVLEQGFNIDTGAAKGTGNQASGAPVPGTQMFARQSYVGYSSAWGEVKLGKMWTPFDDVNGVTDAVFDSKLSPANYVFTSVNYNANPGNSVYYVSPNFAGFTGAVMYSLGENKTAAVDAGLVASLNVQYTGGPFYAALGYQTEKNNDNAVSRDFARVNASYELGAAKLLASFGRTETNSKSTKEWQLGVDYAVTNALTVSGSAARSKGGVLMSLLTTAAGAPDVERTGYGIGASYSLSKRTSLYGGYTDTKEKTPGLADTESSLFAVGVRHAF